MSNITDQTALTQPDERDQRRPHEIVYRDDATGDREYLRITVEQYERYCQLVNTEHTAYQITDRHEAKLKYASALDQLSDALDQLRRSARDAKTMVTDKDDADLAGAMLGAIERRLSADLNATIEIIDATRKWHLDVGKAEAALKEAREAKEAYVRSLREPQS